MHTRVLYGREVDRKSPKTRLTGVASEALGGLWRCAGKF